MNFCCRIRSAFLEGKGKAGRWKERGGRNGRVVFAQLMIYRA